MRQSSKWSVDFLLGKFGSVDVVPFDDVDVEDQFFEVGKGVCKIRENWRCACVPIELKAFDTAGTDGGESGARRYKVGRNIPVTQGVDSGMVRNSKSFKIDLFACTKEPEIGPVAIKCKVINNISQFCGRLSAFGNENTAKV